jgi:hypothetical protein
MAWIHISTQSFSSFDRAAHERSTVVLPHLVVAFKGESNVKVRIRRRHASRFDVVSWRRESTLDSAATQFAKIEPAVNRMTQATRLTKTKFSAFAALAILTMGDH